MSENADRDLFELYRTAIADVPLPGGAVMRPEWDTWSRTTLTSPTFDPAFVFVGVKDGQMVGMTQIELMREGPAITNATCVLREHRGHGLATALKVRSLEALKGRGYKEARTHNDTANPSIIHVNEKLGYRRIPGWMEWEKPL